MNKSLNLGKIKLSAARLLSASEDQRNNFLHALSRELLLQKQQIIKANEQDVAKAKRKLTSALLQRLKLDDDGIEKLALKLKSMKKLQAGLGEAIEERVGEGGLIFKKVRVPLGVILIIYEARPEVTIDVAALCIKSGNAALLKGGSEALETNKVLVGCISTALASAGFDKETVSFVESSDRRITRHLLKEHEYIDLVIARGGYGLVREVMDQSKIPVLAHAAGGARIYVDETADLAMAEKIILNAKLSKPAACNSLDSIVVHRKVASEWLTSVISGLKKKGVEIIKNDWDTEFLGLRVSIKVVGNSDEAIDFINRHSKGHSEGIVASNKKVIEQFTKSIDAAAVFVNCSTRLHDGYVFGLGSEMGISTGKLHARGPVGPKELTTYKWEVHGHGQIRE